MDVDKHQQQSTIFSRGLLDSTADHRVNRPREGGNGASSTCSLGEEGEMDSKSTRLSRLWGGKSSVTATSTHHASDDDSDLPPAPPPKDNVYSSLTPRNSPYGPHSAQHTPSSSSLLTTSGGSKWQNFVGQAQDFGARLITPSTSQVSLVPPSGSSSQPQPSPSQSPAVNAAKNKFKLPLLRRKPSKSPSIATDDSGDSSISTPWNFKHDLHIDETYLGLPPEWSSALEAAGYSPEEIHAIYARQNSMSPQGSSRGFSPPNTLPAPRGESARKSPSPLTNKNLPDPQSITFHPTLNGLPASPAPTRRSPQRIPAPPIPPDTSTKPNAQNNGIPLSPPPQYTSPQSTPKHSPSPQMRSGDASTHFSRGHTQQPSFWEDDQDDQDDSRRLTIKPQDFAKAAKSIRTNESSDSERGGTEESDSERETGDTLSPLNIPRSATLPPRLSLTLPDGTRLSSTAPILTLGLGVGAGASSSSSGGGFGLDLDDWSKELLDAIPRGDEDSSSSTSAGSSVPTSAPTSINSVPPPTPAKSKTVPPPTSSFPSKPPPTSTTLPSNPSSSRKYPPSIDTPHNKPPSISTSISITPNTSNTASPISASPSAASPTAGVSLVSPPKRQQSLSAASRLAHSKASSSAKSSPTATTPRPSAPRTNTNPTATSISPSSAVSTSPLLPSPALSDEPPKAPSKPNPKPEVQYNPPPNQPATTVRYAPVPIIPLNIPPRNKGSPTSTAVRTKRMSTSLSAASTYPQRQLSALISEVNGGTPVIVPPPPEETKQAEEEEDEEEDDGLLPYLRTTMNTDGEKTPTKNNATLSFPSPPSTIPSQKDVYSRNSNFSDRYSARSSSGTTVTAVDHHLVFAQPTLIMRPPQESKVVRPISVAGTLNGSGSSKGSDEDEDEDEEEEDEDGGGVGDVLDDWLQAEAETEEGTAAEGEEGEVVTAVIHELAKPLEKWIKQHQQDVVHGGKKTFNNMVKVAEGQFGAVFSAEVPNAKASEVVAIKTIASTKDNSLKILNVARELELLGMNCGWVEEKVLGYRGVYWIGSASEEGGEVWLEMELMERSLADVLAFIQEQREEGNMQWAIEERMIARFAYDILGGLDYLQGLNVAHRDIRSDNLLFSRGGVLKLADFSNATLTSASKSKRTSVGGQPPYWMAPEMRKGLPYDPHEADIWSTGATIWEVCKGDPPFIEVDDPNMFGDLYPSLEAGYDGPPRAWSKELKSFLRMCEMESGKRPRAVELLRSPFVRNSCPISDVVQMLNRIRDAEEDAKKRSS